MFMFIIIDKINIKMINTSNINTIKFCYFLILIYNNTQWLYLITLIIF